MKMMDDLADIIDQVGLGQVMNRISGICSQKASLAMQLRENELGAIWNDFAYEIEVVSKRIRHKEKQAVAQDVRTFRRNNPSPSDHGG